MSSGGKTREPFVSRAPRLGFAGGLDGMRGIGVLAVMFGHALNEYTESFAVWVDLFFVISGFLIATLLIQEHGRNEHIDVKKFYSRRAFRLLPSMWALFIFAFVIMALVDLSGGLDDHGKKVLLLPELLREIAATATFTNHNFYPVGYGLVYAGKIPLVIFGHLWSLSIEEQFYLLIVPLMIFVLKRRERVRIAMGVFVVAAITIALCRYTAHPGPRLLWLQRPDGLLWGVLAAFVNAHLTEEFMVKHRKKFLAGATVGLLFIAVALTTSMGLIHKPLVKLTHADPHAVGIAHWWFPIEPKELGFKTNASWSDLSVMYWWRFGYTLCQVGAPLVVISLARYSDWWLSKFLSMKWFRWLGRMSYTLYIWHGFLYIITEPLKDGLGKGPLTVLRFIVTFAVCIPVHYKIERPMMNRKLKYASEKETVDVNTGKMVEVVDGHVEGTVPPPG